jgi:ABC-type transport system involved in multi-copper enzyme maturation permease subunit
MDGTVQDQRQVQAALRPPSALHLASAVRAWCYLVGLSLQRQARVRQMVWIALGLLGLAAVVVGLNTLAGRWSMGHWRWRWMAPIRTVGFLSEAPGAAHTPEGKDKQGAPVSDPERKPPEMFVLTYDETATQMEQMSLLWPLFPAPSAPAAAAVQEGVAVAARDLLAHSGFYVFSNWFVFSIFLSFLLPIWSLSFATEALGGEREGRNLIWLLTRPLPRPSIYLAKFVALLPWTLGLNLGGFGLLCALAGPPGRLAFQLYWPAVLAGTLAFAALFHLMGALFRRSAVIALVYAFFLETILGNMPGYMKRLSLSFYTRCLMFDEARDYAIQAEKPSIYMPVDGSTAWYTLLGTTVVLLVVGMIVFARTEYQDLT